MQSFPGSALEVIETEFFFQLLVRLLANPSFLDGSGQGAQVSLRRQVGEIEFLLSRRPVFADEPNLLPRQILLTLVPDALRWSLGDPHAPGRKAGRELALRAGAPADGLPFGMGQHVFGRDGQDVGYMPLSRATALGNRPDHLHIGRIYLEVPRNADRPGKLAGRKPLAKRRTQPVTGIRQYAAKAHAGRNGTVDLRQSDLRLRPWCPVFGRNACSLQPG